MVVVLICSILCLLFTFLESVGRMKNGMTWGFALVTLIGCIHYNYGTDYMSYYNVYQQISSRELDFGDFISGDIYKDSGWAIINYFFKYLGGFFVLVAVLNIIQNFLVYEFLKREVNREWWWLGVFIYLFTYTLYPMNFSMMRQGFVICSFLGLWPLIIEKKIWVTVPTIFLLSTVHHSALVLLPFSFWGYLKFKKLRLVGVIFIVILLLFWFNSTFLNDIFAYIVGVGEMDRYVDIYGDSISNNGFGVGFLLYQIPVMVSFLFYFWGNQSSIVERSLVSLAMIGTIIAPFTTIIQLAGRIGIYFNIYKIFAIPCVYSYIKNRFIRYFLLGLFIVITLVDYFRFFLGAGWIETYGTFHTIFEAL